MNTKKITRFVGATLISATVLLLINLLIQPGLSHSTTIKSFALPLLYLIPFQLVVGFFLMAKYSEVQKLDDEKAEKYLTGVKSECVRQGFRIVYQAFNSLFTVKSYGIVFNLQDGKKIIEVGLEQEQFIVLRNKVENGDTIECVERDQQSVLTPELIDNVEYLRITGISEILLPFRALAHVTYKDLQHDKGITIFVACMVLCRALVYIMNDITIVSALDFTSVFWGIFTTVKFGLILYLGINIFYLTLCRPPSLDEYMIKKYKNKRDGEHNNPLWALTVIIAILLVI